MAHAKVAVLESELAGYRTALSNRDEMIVKLRAERDTAIKARNEAQMEFADLKRRLHNAELINERMRGYLARVQEDDTVREELITVGEPGGVEKLVPKRKPWHVPDAENAYMDTRAGSEMQYMSGEELRRQRKHWIEY